jgi:hypothetical protein
MQCLQTKLEPITYATTTPMDKRTSFLNGTKFNNWLLVIQNMIHLQTNRNPHQKHKMENKKPCVKKLAYKHKKFTNHKTSCVLKFQITKKKWFENPQLGIISQILNNSNPLHIWIDSKLKHN